MKLFKDEIIDKLHTNHLLFINYIQSLNEVDFNAALPGKWNAGQQIDHIIRAVKPLTQAFMLPGFMLKIMFGSANRTGKSYEALVEKYKNKLSEGGRASGQFIPPVRTFDERKKLVATLQKLVNKLKNQVNKYSENDLDFLILPHPLLGRVTLREMLYFTIYHVAHHHRLTEEYLKTPVGVSNL